ncbi:hypothetical protein [Desulfoplanes formicivorans]|uniref:Uncharacterized protein n=1 Tax=Desulfoplanes formicivorans TaxID=1592317 RepID=A0A194AG96_9BACT|nr:hypothetical protein [Desulfoplanes formicivorans]GAU08348.1 hypothetical protein DPF_1054 [Desulfoplanes formicivorans]
MVASLDITDTNTRFRVSKNPDGTILLDCQGEIACIETFPDGQALARFCQENKVDLNTFFTQLATWDKSVAAQFAKGIYR